MILRDPHPVGHLRMRKVPLHVEPRRDTIKVRTEPNTPPRPAPKPETNRFWRPESIRF